MSEPAPKYSPGDRVVGVHSGTEGTVQSVTPAGPWVLFDGDKEPICMHGTLHVRLLLSAKRIEYLYTLAERFAGRYQEGLLSMSDGHITIPMVAFSALIEAAQNPASIEELIERSSLGTPEAKAIRERADDDVVQRTLQRADELDALEAYSERCPKCHIGTIEEDSTGAFCSRRYATVSPCDWWVIA